MNYGLYGTRSEASMFSAGWYPYDRHMPGDGDDYSVLPDEVIPVSPVTVLDPDEQPLLVAAPAVMAAAFIDSSGDPDSLCIEDSAGNAFVRVNYAWEEV